MVLLTEVGALRMGTAEGEREGEVVVGLGTGEAGVCWAGWLKVRVKVVETVAVGCSPLVSREEANR